MGNSGITYTAPGGESAEWERTVLGYEGKSYSQLNRAHAHKCLCMVLRSSNCVKCLDYTQRAPPGCRLSATRSAAVTGKFGAALLRYGGTFSLLFIRRLIHVLMRLAQRLPFFFFFDDSPAELQFWKAYIK